MDVEPAVADARVSGKDQVQRFTQAYLARWWSTQAEPPPGEPCYPPAEQAKRERALKAWLERLTGQLEAAPTEGPERALWQRQLREATATLCRTTLDLDEQQTAILLDEELAEAGLAFVQQARQFDAGLSADDIYQASRNAWTISGLQLLLGRQVRLSRAGLAYSLLYPYSDNYLDDPAVSPAAKADSNARFRAALQGVAPAPATPHEQAVWGLVRLVEAEYPRQQYPDVWSSLLAIHDAQVRSLALQRGHASPYTVDVLGLSFAKGGASVLADGYLAAGALTETEAEQAFGYGVVLQLVDDLQDVGEDLQRGHLTVFSQAARAWQLDALTDRLLGFAAGVLSSPVPSDVPRVGALRTLMARSVTLLVLDAVARHERLYTPAYVAQRERCSPFRFRALRLLRRRLRKQRAALASWIEHESVHAGAGS